MSENETKDVVDEVVDEEIDLDFEVDETGEATTDEDKEKIIKTLTAQKNHWRKKAIEKGESKPDNKVEEKPADKQESTDLSQTDLYTLIKNDVSEEDIPTVVKYAKLEGISVAEALKSDVVTTILDTRKEKRTVAQATNTGKGNVKTGGLTDEQILADARKGILPESDEDIARLSRLRMGLKK